jgi:hypothetical protein
MILGRRISVPWILLLLVALPAMVQAQIHYNTFSISSSANTNNTETLGFVPTVDGTATVTYNLSLSPTAQGAEASVAVYFGNDNVFSAELVNTPEYIYYPLSELIVNGSNSISGATANGDYTFGVYAGTLYSLAGSGTIYNPLGFDSVGTGDFQASITVPFFDYIYQTNNGTVTIGYYAGTGGAITIPSTINGMPVVSIGLDAFERCSNLTSVTIPDSVTNIGDFAFVGCTGLASVTIGTNVASIGDGAFSYCTNLTSVTIPNSVTMIGGATFNTCYSLGSVTIGTNVASIGVGAFSYCTNLTSVTIPNSVTYIGDYAFVGCYSLSSVTIPSGVTYIGEGTFNSCFDLTSVTIPKSVTYIGDDAFLGCYSLSSVTIPSGVTYIGVYAFGFCQSLANVMLPNSVTNIGDYAFEYCSILSSAYFDGNAPSADCTVFEGDEITAYYLPGTSGWGSTFACVPTAFWFLPNPLILNNVLSFGVQSNKFGFTISWATNASVVVEACTDLANPTWSSVGTNALTNGSGYFSDPQWTNYPARFYRLRSP